MADGAVLVAVKSVMFDFNGQQVYVHAGRTTAREGHPVLKGREDLFEPLVPTFEVEEAPSPPPAAVKQPTGRSQQPRPAGKQGHAGAKG